MTGILLAQQGAFHSGELIRHCHLSITIKKSEDTASDFSVQLCILIYFDATYFMFATLYCTFYLYYFLMLHNLYVSDGSQGEARRPVLQHHYELRCKKS